MPNPWISNLADIFRYTAISALGAGFRALRDPGGFLRDELPPEADGLTKWVQDRNRRACRQHARNEAAGLYSDLGALRRPRYGHCKPYLDSINEGPISGGSYSPPFTGGQCSVAYRVFTRSFVTPGNAVGQNVCTDLGIGQVTPNSGVLGPIKGIRIQSTTVGGFPAELSFLQYGNNQELQLGSRFQGCLQPSHQITSIIRVDGQPDNCGDPPSEYKPPKYPTGLPPLPPPTIAPPGGDGSDDIQVDPDGNWRICENGDCTPWFPPGGGGGPDSGGGPGEPDGDPQETDPNDPDNPNEVSGCVGGGNLLTGLKINFTQIPPHQAPLGDIYYRVCWVWMGPDSDKLDLVIDGRTMQDGQFVIPDSRDCTCYKVRANAGWRLEVQAYSRPKEE